MKEENVMQGQFSVEEKTVKGQARAAEENGGMKEMTDGEKTDTVSATLKKFKDVNALAAAYSSLEAEFTRRSQKIKRLEKLLTEQGGENQSAAEKQTAEELGALNAENLPQTEKTVEEVSPQVKGVEESSGIVETATVKEEILPQSGAAKSSGTVAGVGVDTPSSVELSKERLYELATKNEAVRLQIIGDYLSSLSGSSAPLMRGGKGTMVSPVEKAKTISQAGVMALDYFKKRS